MWHEPRDARREPLRDLARSVRRPRGPLRRRRCDARPRHFPALLVVRVSLLPRSFPGRPGQLDVARGHRWALGSRAAGALDRGGTTGAFQCLALRAAAVWAAARLSLDRVGFTRSDGQALVAE